MGLTVIAGITEAQRAALDELAPALDEATYLAGGVAVAVQLHHRTSLDLDLFVAHDFDAERLVEHLLRSVPALQVVGRAPGTVHAELAGVPISILRFRYGLLEPARSLEQLPVRVASLEDLACMKLSAIAGRGAAKDFWDLDELLEHGVGGGDLAGVLALYQRKYANEDVGHVIRSLAYFAEADAEPLPRGLTPARWESIKRTMSERVRRL